MSLQQIKKIKGVLLEGIENLVLEKNCSYIEATVLFCSTNGIDLEQAGNIIGNNELMTSKIQIEAEDLNFLKKP